MYTRINTAMIAVAILIATATGCSDSPKGDTAIVKDEQAPAVSAGANMPIDTGLSHIQFTGYGVGKNHPGRFHLASGNVSVMDNRVTGGEFVVNINSLMLEEQAEIVQVKLKPHLLSDDFFNAATYGTAKFVLTKVESYTAGYAKDSSVIDGANMTISGNLTLKDVTKNITFPAKVEMSGDILTAKANFTIDRRDWSMVYGNDKSLGNKFISEKVNVELDVKANKQ